MTIGTGGPGTPDHGGEPSGDRSPACDERSGSGLAGLVAKALDSSPAAWRLVLLLVVAVLLVGGLLWMVPLDIQVGPITISPAGVFS